ncbi:hypothetical protein [Rahnella bonaserana]
MKTMRLALSLFLLISVSFHAFSSDDDEVMKFKEGMDMIIAQSESNDPNLDPLIKELGTELKREPPRVNERGEHESFYLMKQYQYLVDCEKDQSRTELYETFKAYVFLKDPLNSQSLMSDDKKRNALIKEFWKKADPIMIKYHRCPLATELR